VEHRARTKGLQPVVLNLSKHFNPFEAVVALPRLIRFMRENRFDIIHAHMTNAHLLGGYAARRALPKARVVATFYEPEGPRQSFRPNLLLKRYTDGAVVITPRARENLVRLFKIPESRIAVIEPGLDVARFQVPVSRAEARASFGLKPEDMVIGMVTRIREARRLDVVIEATARLAARYPTLKLMIVGRGGEGAVESIIERPAEELGIRDRVVLPGYCRERRLVDAYKAMDLLAYPFPGTDPSCRTVREAMAAGLPVVAGRSGYPMDLVREGKTGFVAELEPQALATALEALLADPVLREQAGARAALDARERFESRTQAGRCLAFYDSLGSRR
jgi:glycosyltransferase involved in cell wall biosynthesis